MLRPGNAGSNTAADHIAVLTAAIGQVPTAHRRKLLIRADGAGASHGLLDWITDLNTQTGPVRSVRPQRGDPQVGYAVTDKVRDAITKVPESAWAPAITARVNHANTVTSSRSPTCSTSRTGRPGCGS